jgi:hypothetical protein
MVEKVPTSVELTLSPDTQERIEFSAKVWGLSVRETTEKLLADNAEAEAGLNRGPHLRKYMYR